MLAATRSSLGRFVLPVHLRGRQSKSNFKKPSERHQEFVSLPELRVLRIRGSLLEVVRLPTIPLAGLSDGSGRAELPRPALASGNDAKAMPARCTGRLGFS